MSPRPPKILVVFFSRTGTTRRLAEAIARASRGDLEPLREPRSRRGLWGWLRSGYDGTYQKSATTLPLAHDLLSYDVIFVGSPTWNRALSSPVRGFLQRHGAQLQNVTLFATCDGNGADAVVQQMAALLPSAPLSRLAMLRRDVERGPAVEVGELIETTTEAWEQRRAVASASA